MDYKKIYYNIIEHRLANPVNSDVYSESHHIVPKSLGGSDEKSNLVKLTAREHYICHLLLSEMYEKYTNEWYKMNHALLMMNSQSNDQQRYFNNRLYALKRADFSSVMSFSQSGSKNSQFGRPRTDETKKKIQHSIRNRLGILDGLTTSERRHINNIIDKQNNMLNGVFINKQRRKKIKEVFGIDFENRCDDAYIELKTLLNDLYINRKFSTTKISKIYTTNNETIRNYLKFVGIDRRELNDALITYYKKDI